MSAGLASPLGPGGGTGRRRGLKPLGPQGRAGSNPAPGTERRWSFCLIGGGPPLPSDNNTTVLAETAGPAREAGAWPRSDEGRAFEVAGADGVDHIAPAVVRGRQPLGEVLEAH